MDEFSPKEKKNAKIQHNAVMCTKQQTNRFDLAKKNIIAFILTIYICADYEITIPADARRHVT